MMPVTPIVSAAHNYKTTLARSVEIVNGQAQVNDSPNIPPFYVGISQSGLPRGFKFTASAFGGSPRATPPTTLRHASGLTGPSLDLRAGFRCNVLSYGLLELLDNGINITTGQRIVAIEFAAAPIDVLYPLEGIISDMDGNPIGNMSLGIWGGTELHDITAGEFEDYDGEAPIEFGPQLMRNVDVMIGTTRFRVMSAVTDYNQMNVRLRLRKADEPLA